MFITQFEQPTDTASVEITLRMVHPSVVARHMTASSSVDVLEQVIQIYEQGFLNAPPGALRIQIKLLVASPKLPLRLTPLDSIGYSLFRAAIV